MQTNTTAIPKPAINPAHVRSQAELLLAEGNQWLRDNWLQILIAVGVGAAIVVALLALRGVLRRWCLAHESGTGWSTIMGHAAGRTKRWFIVLLAARLVAGYADPPQMVATTIAFLFTLAAVFQTAIWAREIILGAIEHRTRSEHYSGEALLNAMGLIRLLVSVTVFAVALVVVLDNLGVNVTGLVAGLGVGGIAIGLAAQGIFADLFAALAIIFDRPFKRGDKVSYDNTQGVIEAIGLKSTRIRAFTGEIRVIANKNLLDKEIRNTSIRNHVRVQLTVGVAYETPPDTLARVSQMLHDMVEAEGATVARASFEAFGASSLDFIVQFDVPGDDWPTAHATRDRIMVAIVRRFAEERIVIPYPTQTTYTAAPDGSLVMPYAPPPPAPPA